DDAIKTGFNERIFNVSINDNIVLKKLNIAAEFGENQAIIKKFIVNVHNGSGISIHFGAIKGEPIINALRVYRDY
ncbi:MAG: malectin domain-containing carbohydrate-binding protein, partial [Bacteroidia bacterium]|nr:malectin domain-containing carbohydrate-binding protein [Bacteroidia bacterium]